MKHGLVNSKSYKVTVNSLKEAILILKRYGYKVTVTNKFVCVNSKYRNDCQTLSPIGAIMLAKSIVE